MDIDDREPNKIGASTANLDNKVENLDDKMEVDDSEVYGDQRLAELRLSGKDSNSSGDRIKIYFEQLIQHAFGICPDSEYGACFREEFLNLNDLSDFNVLNLVQAILMKVVNDLLHCESYESASRLIQELNTKRAESSLSKFGDASSTTFKFAKEIYTFKDKSVLTLLYLMDCYHIIEGEEKINKTKQFIKQILGEIKEQCVNYGILLLTNKFSQKVSFLFSPLFPFVLHQSAPNNFIPQIIVNTYNENGIEGDFAEIFHPLLQNIWLGMMTISLFSYSSSECCF